MRLNDWALLLLVLSGIAAVYLMVGYPVLLWVCARIWGRPVRLGVNEPEATMILAVHNGARYLDDKLQSILELDYPREKLRVLVVSDGSTDQTDEIVSRAAERMEWAGRLKLVRVAKGGKCRAINAGLEQATGEILVLTDVRQKLDSPSLRLLMENFADPGVGVASGALTILDGSTREEAATGLYWKYELWIRRQLSRLDSIFGATGAYYAMRRELAVRLPGGALLDDMHLPLGAFFAGYRLVLDERVKMFDEPTVVNEEFSRKARTLAGNYEILFHYWQLLIPGWCGGNRLWWHFISYKFGRLLLPWILVLGIVASAILDRGWREWILGLELSFCMLAVAAPYLPGIAGKIASPVRAFCGLMLAGMAAPFWLLKPESRRWRTR